jgi:hypothetical protein
MSAPLTLGSRRCLESLRPAFGANRRAVELAGDRSPPALGELSSRVSRQRILNAAEDALSHRAKQPPIVSLIAIYKALGGVWTLDVTSFGECERLQGNLE